MMNLNLQFFAHKKGVGSTKNGRDTSMTGITDPNLRQLMTNLIIELYKYQAESERPRNQKQIPQHHQ